MLFLKSDRFGVFVRLLAAIGLMASIFTPASAAMDSLVVPAKRIVSLAPHLTENLYAIGAGAQLVGVSAYSDYPAQARELAQVGDAGQVNIEAILSLKPDLVVAWDHGGAMPYMESLKRFGVPVWVDNPQSIHGIFESLRQLGKLTGRDHEAAALVEQLTQDFEAIRHRPTDMPKDQPVPVFFEVWSAPLMTANRSQLVSDIIRWCGGNNVFAELKEVAPLISVEAVLERSPSVILVDQTNLESSRATWLPWSSIPAVKHGQIYGLNVDTLYRPTPRALLGTRSVCKALNRVRAIAPT